MARGWESKSIEQQQEEMAERRKVLGASPVVSTEQQERIRRRDGLRLSRLRLTQQLQTAQNSRHRELLSLSLAELDRQLAALE